MSDQELLNDAFKFHGHKCWASTIGVRGGLAALKTLGVERTALRRQVGVSLPSRLSTRIENAQFGFLTGPRDTSR